MTLLKCQAGVTSGCCSLKKMACSLWLKKGAPSQRMMPYELNEQVYQKLSKAAPSLTLSWINPEPTI